MSKHSSSKLENKLKLRRSGFFIIAPYHQMKREKIATKLRLRKSTLFSRSISLDLKCAFRLNNEDLEGRWLRENKRQRFFLPILSESRVLFIGGLEFLCEFLWLLLHFGKLLWKVIAIRCIVRGFVYDSLVDLDKHFRKMRGFVYSTYDVYNLVIFPLRIVFAVYYFVNPYVAGRCMLAGACGFEGYVF
ncbi:unnamed protein product [Lathyrus sativus]|nr:unnamed protein product [Lathyrus sativus]